MRARNLLPARGRRGASGRRKAELPRAVFLTGFMGAGKTSVGRALARRLGWRFVDLDRRIEAAEGSSIRNLFEQRGEPGFREAESAALHLLLAEIRRATGTVAALGGGTLTLARNRQFLRQHGGTLVFLEAPLRTLHRRCRRTGRQRPLFANYQQFRQLYLTRLPFYSQSTLRVSTWRKRPHTVAAEVATALGLGPGQEVR